MTEECLDERLRKVVDRISYGHQQKILGSQRAVEMSEIYRNCLRLQLINLRAYSFEDEDLQNKVVTRYRVNGEIFPAGAEFLEMIDLLEQYPDLPSFQSFGKPSYRIFLGLTKEMYPIHKDINRFERRHWKFDAKKNPNHNSTRQRLMHRKARRDIAKLLN